MLDLRSPFHLFPALAKDSRLDCLVMALVCRGTKVLENRNVADEERIQQLETELEQTILFGEEADHKFEIV